MAGLLDKFKKRNDSSGEKGIMIRDYARMKINSLLLAGGAIASMLLVCFVLLYKNAQLVDRINREVYVAVENKVYKALPQERGLDEKDLKLFVKSVCANMFAHDQFSYAERTEAVRNLMNETTFNYILKKFEYHGQPITAYYKKFDARLYYTVSDTDIAVKKVDKNFEVVVHGRQRAVFAVGNPVESPLNMAFFVKEIDRTDKNMFGLLIYNFNFLK
ncbi:MAG: hypothetical protein LBK47_06675 [Prevotellaceae bacterium]|jgi:hypothetical protein|nr:hypothetical protein [Prevotellaceae bacterium]